MYLLEFMKRPFTTWLPLSRSRGKKGLGTFLGVYLPSVLQMLGVILFMRLGWLTGHMGLPKMTVIILMASSILFVTGLSMSSIVTNMKVGNGGSYYIISRSLGMGFGSAIGLLLTLAQLTTVAICISGFAISLRELLPQFSLIVLEVGALITLTVVSLLPIKFALKAQGLIFGVVISSIVSVFCGSGANIPETITALPSTETLTFWAAFALFFPATTGIESGMAMSGDLKNPSRSLAIGAMAAVITAFITYISLSVFLSREVPLALLRSHPMIIYTVSKVSALFILGVWGATLSSALGGLLSAPRTLQALAKDRILPSLFGREYGKIKQPRAATILAVCFATLLTLFTDMNHLLPILSMVCLITYGILNFVAFFESLLQNPSWRPLFKIPMFISLAGTIACFASMFMINAGWSFISLCAVGLLCFWTSRRNLKDGDWDDIRYSIFSFFAASATNKLMHLSKNPRSWRPNILAIVDPKLKNAQLIHFAHALNRSKGFLTYGTTLAQKDRGEIKAVKGSFESYFQERDIPCFSHINSHQTPLLGTRNIVKNYGLGPLQPNTIILKAPEEKISSFCELIYTTSELKKNLIILKNNLFSPTFTEERKDKHIDLWWGGKYHANFELSLALAQLLQSGKLWLDSTITIKSLVSDEAGRSHMTKLFKKYHKILRFKNLKFKTYIDETNDFYSHIADYSTEADLTFLGLRAILPDEPKQEYEAYYNRLMEKTKGIPNVAYILAGEELNFQKILE
ncbi:MAG: hypothetical protein K1060chlam2_00689 [Chlamydiae bacterium]|nr:hypothetical protein [Chlamydiota bacterium]